MRAPASFACAATTLQFSQHSSRTSTHSSPALQRAHSSGNRRPADGVGAVAAGPGCDTAGDDGPALGASEAIAGDVAGGSNPTVAGSSDGVTDLARVPQAVATARTTAGPARRKTWRPLVVSPHQDPRSATTPRSSAQVVHLLEPHATKSARKSLDGALFALSSRLDWAVLLASTMP